MVAASTRSSWNPETPFGRRMLAAEAQKGVGAVGSNKPCDVVTVPLPVVPPLVPSVPQRAPEVCHPESEPTAAPRGAHLFLVPNLPGSSEYGYEARLRRAALEALRVPLHINDGLQAATLAALFEIAFRVGDYPSALLEFSVAVLRLVEAERERRRGFGDPAEHARLDAEVRRLYPTALQEGRARFHVSEAPPATVNAEQYLTRVAANDMAPAAQLLATGTVQSVALSSIYVDPGRRRRADLAHVEQLALSIGTVGLILPIVVTSAGELVAGLHRPLAHEKLGEDSIPAYVRDLAGQSKRLVEIDENLVRRELPVLEAAELTLERKKIYESLHPEATQHRRGGHAKAAKRLGEAASAHSALAASFAADTARKTGLDKRRVQELTQIAGICAAAKDVIRGTALGAQKTELINLSRLPEHEQHAAALAVTAGQVGSIGAAVSAARSTVVNAAPYAVTQAPYIRRHLAAAGRLQKELRATADGWAARDAVGMKSFISRSLEKRSRRVNGCMSGTPSAHWVTPPPVSRTPRRSRHEARASPSRNQEGSGIRGSVLRFAIAQYSAPRA